jgi:prophage antirepressor-like protein
MPRKIKNENTSSIVAKEIIPFDFGKLTLTTIVDGDGNPWWIAKEVCDVLGYAHTPSAIRNHCKYSQIITVSKQHSIRGNPNKTIINESDLYRLIIGSHLPAA